VQFRAASHLADLSRRCGEVEFADGLARFLRLLFAGGYAGTAGGIISTAAGLAARLSPAAFGYLTDVTGSYLPSFAVSMLLLLTGMGAAFFVRADRPLDTNKPFIRRNSR
jgi:hypothetical protein